MLGPAPQAKLRRKMRKSRKPSPRLKDSGLRTCVEGSSYRVFCKYESEPFGTIIAKQHRKLGLFGRDAAHGKRNQNIGVLGGRCEGESASRCLATDPQADGLGGLIG